MELRDYSLKFKDNVLFEDLNITFKEKKIHHILGKNGSGKSSFAKSVLGAVDYKGTIDVNNKRTIVIGSYTNIPLEYKVKDILEILKNKYKNKYNVNIYEKIIIALDIDSIPTENKLGNLSDGQKQKLKLLFFLSNKPELIVLDEFTTSLDKKTSIEVYKFLNDYIVNFESTIINITHNLSDLKYMPGLYYIVKERKIQGGIDMKDAIDFYIGGDIYEEWIYKSV